MAMEHTSLSSLAAVADATMAPTSPHGSDEADWDFVDESAAKEIEIQRQSDDLRVQEMGATQQLMPLDHAHPGAIDDASLQQMADLAACVERLQIAREAVDQLSPVSSTTGSVLTRLGLEPSQQAVEPTRMDVDDVAGASQPVATEAALTAASSAEGDTGAPDQAKKCWTCRHETLVPYSAPSASMDSGKETWHLLFSHRDAPAAAGASSPEVAVGQANKATGLVDGSRLAQAPPPTTSGSEVTMADVVPMGMRMSVREEILQMGADDEARALNVKLGEEEEQSFQLFHPESAREIALQAKLMQASDQLDNKRKKDAQEEEEAKRRREQDASDWLTMAPIQEGMQSVPDSEVRRFLLSSDGPTLKQSESSSGRPSWMKVGLVRWTPWTRHRRTWTRPEPRTRSSRRQAKSSWRPTS